jgi:SET domain-containing protein
MQTNNIEVRKSPVDGPGKYEEFGVFATVDIATGEVVEIAPVIVMSHEDLVDTKWNVLFDYYFWMDDYVVLALGYGSMYNHSENPNIEYEIFPDKREIKFISIKNIKKGEELLFNYKGKEKSDVPLWFELENKKE